MQEIVSHIQKAILNIANELKFPDTGYQSTHNATGDTQLKLDVKSDMIITEILSQCKSIKALVSEEKPKALELNPEAKYIVAYDPLDGSSLLDVNFAVGSIFGIYEQKMSAKHLKMAIYSIYSARLEFIICTDIPKLYRLNHLNEFEYIKDLKLSVKGKINATGGTQKNWCKTHASFIKSLFDEGYRLRYSGAMVSDIHQILCKGGGLFSYPATSDAPNGKLRAFFEVFPFAYICEKAGGKTSNGTNKSLLELEFSEPHSTTPCFFGSSYEIDKLLSFKVKQ